MALGKLQVAGASALDTTALNAEGPENGGFSSSKGAAVLYGAVAVGVLAGAAVSTYLWRQRVRALNLLNMSPLERAEELISSCESKLEDLERAFENLKGTH